MVVQEFEGRVGGVKVEAVDTTGAGDAFIGGIFEHFGFIAKSLQGATQ